MRWTPEEKVRIVEETYLPGMSVSLVARQHGITGSQVFTWRRLMNQGALVAAAAGEEVVPDTELVADIRLLVADLLRTATAVCMPYCAAKPSRPGAQRPIQSASTAL